MLQGNVVWKTGRLLALSSEMPSRYPSLAPDGVQSTFERPMPSIVRFDLRLDHHQSDSDCASRRAVTSPTAEDTLDRAGHHLVAFGSSAIGQLKSE